jgi:hypothetical protein
MTVTLAGTRTPYACRSTTSALTVSAGGREHERDAWRYASAVRSGSLYDWIQRGIGAYARLDLRVQQRLQAVRDGVAGALSAALSPSEKAALTIHLYSLQSVAPMTTLSDWEVVWFMRALPPSPARLLLAAAGDGRELDWLREAGYSVDAFEPAPAHAEVLRARADPQLRAAAGSFRDLIGAVLHEEHTPLRAFAQQRYAAVILGWGSLTHVLEPSERAHLMRACDRLSPDGPILASFWLRGPAAPASAAHAQGVAWGSRLAKLRGHRPALHAGDAFQPYCGFTHEYTREEIDALAASVDRDAEWSEDCYPHVTFVKRGPIGRREPPTTRHTRSRHG